MKLGFLMITVLSASVAFAGNKTERKVLVEFPCGIQKTGQIDVTRGAGKILKGFDRDGDGFVTNYCRTDATTLDIDGDGNVDTLITDSYYEYENCSKVLETEKTKEGEVVRNQIIYSRQLKRSSDMSSGCQQAALAIKQLVEIHTADATSNSGTKEAEVLNTLGEKDRVVVNQ